MSRQKARQVFAWGRLFALTGFISMIGGGMSKWPSEALWPSTAVWLGAQVALAVGGAFLLRQLRHQHLVKRLEAGRAAVLLAQQPLPLFWVALVLVGLMLATGGALLGTTMVVKAMGVFVGGLLAFFGGAMCFEYVTRP